MAVMTPPSASRHLRLVLAALAFAGLATATGSQYNCPARGGGGLNCATGYRCCGADTMNPQCIENKDGGEACCTWYLNSVKCNPTQKCCGMMGPGASSYAFCCNKEATCCQASNPTSGTGQCCKAGTTCCRGATAGICCKSDEWCDAYGNGCVKTGGSLPPSTAPAPVTTAAPVAPSETTAAPEEAPVHPSTAAPVAPSESTAAPEEAPIHPSTAAPEEAPIHPSTAAPVAPSETTHAPEEAPIKPSTAAPVAPSETTHAPEEAPIHPSTAAPVPDDLAHVHELCFLASDGTLWRIFADATHTVIARHDGTEVRKADYEAFELPAAGEWRQGVKFASDMQQQQHFFDVTGNVTSAEWTRDAVTRVDTITFVVVTSNGTYNFTLTSTSCPRWANCMARGGTWGLHCWEEFEDCCGANTLHPQCRTKSSGDKCCLWLDSAAKCNATQSCCGMFGPGTSSTPFCCDPGYSCCPARNPRSGPSRCCAPGTTCCGGATAGLCCTSDETCDVEGTRCVKKVDQQQSTSAAGSAPGVTTQAPTATRYTVYARLVIPGGFFATLRSDAAAWAALRVAVAKDIASMLGVRQEDIHITSMEVGSLIVTFTATTWSQEEAAEVQQRVNELPYANLTLSDATQHYRSANPAADGLTVSQVSQVTTSGAGGGAEAAVSGTWAPSTLACAAASLAVALLVARVVG